MKRVLVTGTFCSGKTTLCNDVARSMDDVVVVQDWCRTILDLFPDVNWRGKEIRGYLLIHQLIIEKQELPGASLAVVDGGIINNLAHDRALLSVAPDRSPSLAEFDHDRYNLVLHCSPKGIPLEDDGQRHTAVALRDAIDRHVSDVLDELGYSETIELEGPRDVRCQRAVEAISGLLRS